MNTTQRAREFEIGRHMMSLWVPLALHATAELGVADALASGPQSAHELAARLGTHADATERLLEALLVIGVVERDGARYSLSDLGQVLRSDAPRSRRAWARLMGSERVLAAWGKLSECVRTGQAAFATGERRTRDTETFDALFEDAEAADVFHRAMADGTRSVAPEIVSALDVGGVRSVVDVGGGYGELLCAVLERHPGLQGQVFDLAHARAGAERWLAERGLSTRASFASGDLFREPPPPADLLLLKSVIHDWNDERSLAILERCRSVMSSDAHLVVVEPAAPPRDAPPEPAFAWVVAFSDLNMLVNTGGRERTALEYAALLERARLEVTATRSAGFYTCFVCRKAP